MTNFDQRDQHVKRQYNAGRDINLTISHSKAPVLRKRDRRRILELVQAIWITGVLERSLHGTALITLELHDQPEAVANPWRLVMQEVDHFQYPIPPNMDILQVYDNAGGELLILGEPGCGKTTQLLELARNLLDRARKDESHPMPVIFNLSSWEEKRKPLIAWLVDELHSKYQISTKLGKSWIEKDYVLPLLDGLDEVNPSKREACVKAINVYRSEHGSVPIVVCCRLTDYQALTTKVLLYKAIVIQPLTLQQIDEYLAKGGEKLTAVRTALHEDSMLQELAKTPLMLDLLVLTYHGKKVDDLSGSLEDRREQILAAYVRRMLERRGVNAHFTYQQTVRYMSYLSWHAGDTLFDSYSLIYNPDVMLFAALVLPITIVINVYKVIHSRKWYQIFNILPYWVLWPKLPLDQTEFFNFAVEHILLRKVGRNYIFVHKLLHDYFASLYDPPRPPKLVMKLREIEAFINRAIESKS